MTEKTKKIHIEIMKGKSGISSFGGLWSVVELFRKTCLPQIIDENIGARGKRGAKDSDHVLSLVLLQLAGGGVVDHLPMLQEKLSFEGLGITIPSPTASRKWLGAFHNEEEDNKRRVGKAFLPEENRYLRGFQKTLSSLLTFASKERPKAHLTLDQDATFIETERREAFWNYKKDKSYEALNTYCPEHDLVVGTRYEDGNVPPGWRQLEEFVRVLDTLPEEVKSVALRSDSAGYQSDLLTYCAEGKNPRFGFISAAISCPVREEFKEAVQRVPKTEWKRLGNRTLKSDPNEPLQEWAEVILVPNKLGTKKHGPDYRFLAIRERWIGDLSLEKKTSEKDATEGNSAPSAADEEEAPVQLYIPEFITEMEAEYPKMKKLHLLEMRGIIYKTFGIVTTIADGSDGSLFGYGQDSEMDGEKIILWQRKRCGKSEEIHHILKADLAGGHVPSKRFGANAAWWNIAVLALNLHNLLKGLLLPEAYGKSRPKTIRFLLYTMAAKIVNHGRHTILKIWNGDRGGALFAHVMKALDGLSVMTV